MQKIPSMRQVLDALDWVRREVWRSASPDFIRQRVAEDRVQQLCAELLRKKGGPGPRSAPKNTARK